MRIHGKCRKAVLSTGDSTMEFRVNAPNPLEESVKVKSLQLVSEGDQTTVDVVDEAGARHQYLFVGAKVFADFIEMDRQVDVEIQRAILECLCAAIGMETSFVPAQARSLRPRGPSKQPRQRPPLQRPAVATTDAAPDEDVVDAGGPVPPKYAIGKMKDAVDGKFDYGPFDNLEEAKQVKAIDENCLFRITERGAKQIAKANGGEWSFSDVGEE